jgi:hypothetical protein
MRFKADWVFLVSFVALSLMVSPAGAQNMLTNPSFESDGSGWVKVNQNVEVIFRSDLGSTLIGGSGPGSLELRFSFWNGGANGVFQDVAATEGVTYTAAFSAFAPSLENPAIDAPLIIQWYDADDDLIELVGIHPTFVYDRWMRIEGEVTAPAGTASVRVFPTVSNPIDDEETRPGILYIDDVLFAVAGSGTTMQEVYYPAAASIEGLLGTFWTTDGWFHSTAASPVDLFGAFLPGGGQDNSAAVAAMVMLGTIPAGGSLVVADIVGMLGGGGQTGGIYLRAEAVGGTSLPFLYATSYTSTPNSEGGGSYGQGIPAVDRGGTVMTVAPGAFQNAERRTNAGVLNTSNQTITVRVQVVDDVGATAATATWTLEPYGQRQVSLPSLGVRQINGGSVVFEMTSGTGSYRGYTSTVDAVTGDAVYTAAQ